MMPSLESHAAIGARLSAVEAGFTLIEMLVVLTIMGILAGIALTNLSSRPGSITRGQLHAEIEQAASLARQRAMVDGTPVAIDLAHVAPAAKLRFEPAFGDPLAMPTFYADGTSNGGRVTAAGRPIAEITWMTGHVK